MGISLLEELAIALVGWIPTRMGMAIRLGLWKTLFASCGRVRFGTGLVLQGCSQMALANGVRIGRGCELYAGDGTLEIGEESAFSPGVTIDASGGLIRIGKQVAVGPGTVIRAANHRFDRVDVPIIHQGHEYGEVIIEEDVWIAAHCVITPGSRIGKGAVIGSGAVVTGNIEPYAVAVGIPARKIRNRASSPEANKDRA